MADFHLSIVTPAGKAFDGFVQAVTAPGELGSFGVLNHHAPMIVGLTSGVMTVTDASGVTPYAVGVGVFEVSLGSEVTVLVDHARKVADQEEAAELIARWKAGS